MEERGKSGRAAFRIGSGFLRIGFNVGGDYRGINLGWAPRFLDHFEPLASALDAVMNFTGYREPFSYRADIKENLYIYDFIVYIHRWRELVSTKERQEGTYRLERAMKLGKRRSTPTVPVVITDDTE